VLTLVASANRRVRPDPVLVRGQLGEAVPQGPVMEDEDVVAGKRNATGEGLADATAGQQ
jgi:hypothetical protein